MYSAAIVDKGLGIDDAAAVADGNDTVVKVRPAERHRATDWMVRVISRADAWSVLGISRPIAAESPDPTAVDDDGSALTSTSASDAGTTLATLSNNLSSVDDDGSSATHVITANTCAITIAFGTDDATIDDYRAERFGADAGTCLHRDRASRRLG